MNLFMIDAIRYVPCKVFTFQYLYYYLNAFNTEDRPKKASKIYFIITYTCVKKRGETFRFSVNRYVTR